MKRESPPSKRSVRWRGSINTLDYIRGICEKNVDDIFDKSFKCEPKLYDNTCKYCGGVFKKHIDFVPYSDIHTPMKTWYCPNCD